MPTTGRLSVMLGILVNAHHRETKCDVRHVDNLNMEVNKKHCFEYA